MAERLHAMSVTGTTRVVGIFGDPIAHTLSPAMHNAAFRQAGLDFVYLPFHVLSASLQAAVQSLRALNLVGVNVTVPHKERIVRYLDAFSSEARLCQAVNTVVNRSGTLFGDNTDGRGFLLSLKERGFSPRRKEVILIGAGGSARALLVSLIRAGSGRVTIINRTFKKGQVLAGKYQALGKTQVRSLPLEGLTDPTLLRTTSLIVNCTPVGLHEEAFLPLAYSVTPSTCLFYDLLYRPLPTPFLSQARSARRQTLDGRRMLLHQGALAFSLWTHRPAPLDAMEQALSRSLKGPVI